MPTSRAQSVRILNLICTVEGSAYFSRCPEQSGENKHAAVTILNIGWMHNSMKQQA